MNQLAELKAKLLAMYSPWGDGIPTQYVNPDGPEAATAITDLEALVGELGEAFNDIKQEALTAGSPGCRSSAKAFAHIVRLCIDARATLTKLEKARD